MRKKTVMVFLLSVLFAGNVWAHAGHEHASAIPHVKWGLDGAKELINIHPLFVHFPIALLLAAVVFYFLGSVIGKEDLFAAGKWVLWLGTLSAGLAVWTGLKAPDTVFHDMDIHPLILAHQYLGITILSLSFLLSLWVFISKANIPAKRFVFLGILFLLSLLIVQQADFGGRIVFGKGVGIGQRSMMVKTEK